MEKITLKQAVEDIKKTKCYESHTRVDYVEDVCPEQIEILNKLVNLEEQIGCPIDVISKALICGIYQDGVKGVQNVTLMFDRDYGWILQTYSCDELTKNYKQTWWLEAGRSE